MVRCCSGIILLERNEAIPKDQPFSQLRQSRTKRHVLGEHPPNETKTSKTFQRNPSFMDTTETME